MTAVKMRSMSVNRDSRAEHRRSTDGKVGQRTHPSGAHPSIVIYRESCDDGDYRLTADPTARDRYHESHSYEIDRRPAELTNREQRRWGDSHGNGHRDGQAVASPVGQPASREYRPDVDESEQLSTRPPRNSAGVTVTMGMIGESDARVIHASGGAAIASLSTRPTVGRERSRCEGIRRRTQVVPIRDQHVADGSELAYPTTAAANRTSTSGGPRRPKRRLV